MAPRRSHWTVAACVGVVALLVPATAAQAEAPPVEVTLEPVAHGGTATVLTQVAPAEHGDQERWILNAMWSISVTNETPVTLQETSLTVGGKTGTRTDLGLVIDPGDSVPEPALVLAVEKSPRPHGFQGDMPDHPTTATSTLTFDGYEPLVLNSTLKVHEHETPSGAYQFPLRATDLPADVYWTVGNENQDNTAHHYDEPEFPPEGSQWYAYDIVAKRWTGPPPGLAMCSPFLEPEDPRDPDWDCEWATLTEEGVDRDRNQGRAAGERLNVPLGDYLAYGEPVYAIDSGTILECRDSNADPVPPDGGDTLSANRVWIQHGEGEYAVYTHLKEGSIPVGLCPVQSVAFDSQKPDVPPVHAEPVTVHAGQQIGEIGNTGNSAEPHLHVHLSRRPPVDVNDQGGPGLPLMFDRFKTKRFEQPDGTQIPPGTTGFSSIAAGMPRAIPQAGIVVPLPMVFAGFAAPVNNGVVNAARAGQTIPIKYRLSEHDGTAVSDPASFTSLKSQKGGDLCTGLALDAIEAYAAGGSGLQYLGDGNWQFNWKTPKDFAGQCRTLTLTLGDGSTHTATFQFT